MHTLSREVRFSVNPFLDEQCQGFNVYCSRPCGEGLSLFLALVIELQGPVQNDTGFLVNVVNIDKEVRRNVIGMFVEEIKKTFRKNTHLSTDDLVGLLEKASGFLENKFPGNELKALRLKLNPFRNISLVSKDKKMFYFSEKFEFDASHKLWNDQFSDEKNFEIFGKCANPAGHGHNYVIEVAVRSPIGGERIKVGAFEQIVDSEFVKIVDHKNLNADVSEFEKTNPTVENIAAFAWRSLVGKFGPAELDSVTVWESERTSCRYSE